MRLAVMGDIHGNLVALERAFDFIDKAQVDGLVWCGDYITDILLSHEVLEFINIKNNKYKHWIIKGNREDYILNYSKSEVKNWNLNNNTGSLLLTYKSLTFNDINFIDSLPDNQIISLKGAPTIYLTHKFENVNDYKYVIYGHTHVQNFFNRDGIKYINPGSIGQCCSGQPGLEFSILELIDNEWSVHMYHMDYNRNVVINFIRNSDLNKCYIKWGEALIRTINSGNNYIDYYVNRAKKLAISEGFDCNLTDVPTYVWDKLIEQEKL